MLTREQKRAQMAEVKRRRARVTAIEGDGLYVDVEFTVDNGERVKAHFVRRGWARPPKEALVQFYKSQLSGPETVVYPYPRDKTPRQAPEGKPRT